MTRYQSSSHIRQCIRRLTNRRTKLEKKLLYFRHEMLDACLIERRKLAKGQIRKSPAFYLSRKVSGKTRLTYVRKDDLESVRLQTDRWRDYSRFMAEWVKISAEIEQLFRELAKQQIVKSKEK